MSEPITDEALWDFANDLTDAWNIEDLNPPSLIEVFRDRFVARFGHGSPQGEPSDAQVEAGCRAFYEGARGITSWQRLVESDPAVAENYRRGIRAALLAGEVRA